MQVNNLISNLSCNDTIPCQFPGSEKIGIPTGALPVASRCWADYSPDVDETDMFSCSRSDTCRVSDLQSGVTSMEFGGLADSNREILCNSCPLQQGGYVNPFGCDTLTKQCTCNRPKRERTPCTSNDQCSLGDATCTLVNDFSTGGGYGSIECASCPREKTCHITDMNTGVGKCTCMQMQTPVLACSPSSVGRPVMPDASQMCAVSTDLSGIRTTNMFYSWSSLATAPCALIGPGTAQCYNVRGYGFLVVGRGIARSSVFGGGGGNRRRRILGEEGNSSVPTEFLDWSHSQEGNSSGPTAAEFLDWSHTSQPCRALSDAGSRAGVMDSMGWEKCLHWRRVGASFIREFNVTSLQPAEDNDHFLLSLQVTIPNSKFEFSFFICEKSL